MYSNKSEYSHRRHYSNRDSRPWEEEGRREERLELQRNATRDPYDKYSADGHNRTERLSSREYIDSHKRQDSPDSKRDWRRKSPVRRRMSTPDHSVSEKRQRLSAEQDHYRHPREPEEPFRLSQEPYSHLQRTKDIKRTLSLKEDYSHKRTPEDSRYGHRHDQLLYNQHQDEPSYRRSDREGPERSRDWPQERTRSRDHIKNHTPPRRRSGSFSRDYEDHNQNRTRFSLNGSRQQPSDSNDRRRSPPTTSAGENKLSKGFQRFLNVLNMGVNVETLTRIVNQGAADVNDRPQSPASPNAPDPPWSVGSAQRQQSGLQNARCWSETEQTDTLASPHRCPRLYSSNGKTLSEERAVETSDLGRKFLSSDSRSLSPSPLVKTTLSPEEEHKHRQMQDVLQAIGINLEYEELGQMSNRIQERLYGKKQSDKGLDRREEMARRQAYFPRDRSGSSSRSSSSPSEQDCNKRSHSYSAQREETDVRQTDECGAQQSSGMFLKDWEKTETTTKSTAAVQFNYTTSESAPALPPNPVMNCYPPLPTNMPPVMPSMFMPRVPPFLSYPHGPPVNMFPPIVPQSGSVLPSHVRFSQLPFPNLPPVYPPQTVNTTTQKTKNPNRPRCLQVIQTKEPG